MFCKPIYKGIHASRSCSYTAEKNVSDSYAENNFFATLKQKEKFPLIST